MMRGAWPCWMNEFWRLWGKDVEVLAPEDLCREIAEEMREAARMYGTEELQPAGGSGAKVFPPT